MSSHHKPKISQRGSCAGPAPEIGSLTSLIFITFTRPFRVAFIWKLLISGTVGLGSGNIYHRLVRCRPHERFSSMTWFQPHSCSVVLYHPPATVHDWKHLFPRTLPVWVHAWKTHGSFFWKLTKLWFTVRWGTGRRFLGAYRCGFGLALGSLRWWLALVLCLGTAYQFAWYL
jgi:hypothetical protein